MVRTPGLRRFTLFLLVLLGGVSLYHCALNRPRVRSLEEVRRYMEEEVEPAQKAEYKARKRAGLIPTGSQQAWTWFAQRRRGLDGLTPIAYREEAQRVSRARCVPSAELAAESAGWTYVGPLTDGEVMANGRVIDLAVHPSNDQLIYAATASGGVWKTADQGRNWTNLTDNKIPTLGCGSLAMDPGAPTTLLVGLGEGMTIDANTYEPLGTGIYKTTDDGATWNALPGTAGGTMQFVVDIRFVGNSSTIMAAAAGGQGGAGAGLWRSVNGGLTWTKIWAHRSWSISVDPSNSSNVVATTQEGDYQNPLGRIYYSTNGGASFTPATIPTNTESGRIELTRCQSSPNTMYALVASSTRNIHGIWTSTNGGTSWTTTSMAGVPTDQNSAPGQMSYNNCIAVDPQNASKIFFGSNLRAYKSVDGAGSWAAFTDWDAKNPGWQPDGLAFIHADHHAIAFGATANTIYIGTDGGFFVSTDGGANFVERNNGLNCTQIYRVSNHPDNEYALMMGCQDNCKFIRKNDGRWHHWPNTFGDCMEVVSYPNDSNAFMGANYNGSSIKFTSDGAQTWYPLRYYQNYNNGIPDAEGGAWVTPLMVDPLNPSNIWTLLQNVYRRPYDAVNIQNWTAVWTFPAGMQSSSVEYLELSYGPGTRQAYVGYNRYDQQFQRFAGIQRADIGDGSAAATNPVELTLPRNGYLGTIKCDPNDNNVVWISYTDFNDIYAQQPRVYRSPDKGAAWVDKTNNFPNTLPVSAIFIDPNDSNVVILGTDLGCYRSDDGGGVWYEYNAGLPNTVVTDFAYHAPTRRLRAGTYGRGMWETVIDGAPSIDVDPLSLTFNSPGSNPEPVAQPDEARPLQSAAEKVLSYPVGTGKDGQANLADFAVLSAPARERGSAAIPDAAIVTTLLEDDFEASALAPHWNAFNDPTWGLDDLFARSGSQSIWCCAGGSLGADPEFYYYHTNADSWIASGPFDLSDAEAAHLSFWRDADIDFFGTAFYIWFSTDAGFDPFYTAGYYQIGGDTGGFVGFDIDLSAVGDPLFPWNFLGEDQVYVAFEFESTEFSAANDGVWVDDVLFQKTHPSPLEAPAGVAATEDQINQITVSWNAAADATQYQAYRAQGADNPGQAAPVSAWQAGLTFVDTNVQTATPYFYYVKSGDGAVQSVLSAGDEGRALDDPNATAAQSFIISNAGPGTLSVTGIEKRDGSAWLTFTPPRAFPLTIPPGRQESIAVKASSTGLANGTYRDRLTIRNNTADANPFPDGVDIVFTVGTSVQLDFWTGYR